MLLDVFLNGDQLIAGSVFLVSSRMPFKEIFHKIGKCLYASMKRNNTPGTSWGNCWTLYGWCNTYWERILTVHTLQDQYLLTVQQIFWDPSIQFRNYLSSNPSVFILSRSQYCQSRGSDNEYWPRKGPFTWDHIIARNAFFFVLILQMQVYCFKANDTFVIGHMKRLPLL